jgi:hypothetical protein
MSISASVSGSIKITDNLTGSVSLSKVLNNTYTGTVESYGQSVVVGTTLVTVSLPVSPAQFVYVKNLSNTSATLLTVSWVPTAGGSATVVNLDPGAGIIFSEVTTSNGITALSLQSNVAGTPAEYILAG